MVNTEQPPEKPPQERRPLPTSGVTLSRLVSSLVKGKLYLFGGSCDPGAAQSLPGVHSFDIGAPAFRRVGGWVGGCAALR